MADICADPMLILDGMSPPVWQRPTACEHRCSDMPAEGAHLGTSGYRITLRERRWRQQPFGHSRIR
ncbi:MAG: hypothetical protein JST91_15210 [Actinobacteria bacterium]|nr:hypothetical protein [Actinomycetota bacterium]